MIFSFKKPKKPFSPLGFIHTLYLFTASDHKTFIFPQTAFGILSTLSGSFLTTYATPDFLTIVRRIPRVILWTWLNTFIFVLANQRHPESVAEDLLNKPWRPLAAGRISSEQTKRLLLASVPLSLAIIYFGLGAAEETALLFCLTWMYNDLGRADESFVTRNLIIVVAYSLYGCGAIRVACGGAYSPDGPAAVLVPTTYHWLAILAGVIFTTMQVQDLKDQEGDRVRNRQTAPLVLGHIPARWTVVVPVVFWSFACPLFWRLDLLGYFPPVGLGAVLATRVVRMRDWKADCTTWKSWCYWLTLLYVLPLFKDHSVFGRL